MTDSVKQQILTFMGESQPEFSQHNHIRLVDVGDGWAKAELDLHPESLNVWQVPHGGVLFAMADLVTGVAAFTQRMELCLTVQSSIDFLSAHGPEGHITAMGKVVRAGRRLSFSEAEITDEQGRLLAKASSVLSFSGKKVDLTKDLTK